MTDRVALREQAQLVRERVLFPGNPEQIVLLDLTTKMLRLLAQLDRAEAVVALFAEVAAEGERAKVLHGEPPERTGLQWLAILAEEFGEVAMEVTKGEVPPIDRPTAEYLHLLRGELVQTASVAMRWLAAVDALRAYEDADKVVDGWDETEVNAMEAAE